MSECLLALLFERLFEISGNNNLLGARVFGDGLGTFGDGVLGQFTGQKKSHSGLDFPTGDGRALVVVSQAGGFSGDTFEDIVNEAVHDRHGFAGNASVGMNLLQYLVDVDRVAFLPPALLLLISLGNVLLGLSGLLRGFSTSLGRHFDNYGRACGMQSSQKLKRREQSPPYL